MEADIDASHPAVVNGRGAIFNILMVFSVCLINLKDYAVLIIAHLSSKRVFHIALGPMKEIIFLGVLTFVLMEAGSSRNDSDI